MNRNRPTTSASPKGRFTAGSSRQKRGGFDDLDPSKMGLDVPDWMEGPAASPAASNDGLAAPRESGLGAPEPAPRFTPPEEKAPAQNDLSSRSIVEGMKVVCICKGIKTRVFWKALDEGLCTKEDINRCTGSGSGSCQGRRCGPRILDMIRNFAL
jgi:bacterioferritin-associated ferredoxin